MTNRRSREQINFSKLIENDPHEMELLGKLFNGDTLSRNTFTLEEFSKYEVLFKPNEGSKMDDEEYEALSKEYFNKITPFQPVRLIDDDTGELVMTLPAILSTVDCVSDAGEAGSHAIDAFTNAHSVPDEFDLRKSKYTEHLTRVLDHVQDRKQIEMKREETRRIMEEFNNRASRSSSGEIQTFIPEEVETIDTGLSDEVEYL